MNKWYVVEGLVESPDKEQSRFRRIAQAANEQDAIVKARKVFPPDYALVDDTVEVHVYMGGN